MNKEQRKKLLQDYKKKELEKDLESDSQVIRNFARLQLGLTTEPLTENLILSSNGYQLIELVYYKIEEAAVKLSKENPKENGSKNDVLKGFPFHLQFIYYSHQLEMSLELGDCNKIIESSPVEEIELLAKGYTMLGFQNIAHHLLDASKAKGEALIIEDEFKVLSKSIETEKVEYIKINAHKFQIK